MTLTHNKDQFICAPGLQRARGCDQAEGAVEGLREVGVFDSVVGVTYDTTPSNSSVLRGTVALIEQERNTQVVKIPCRHHIYDLFGKNLRKVVVGRNTTGPGHPLFLRFQSEWGNICGRIDYNNLCTINLADWQGTFLVELTHNVKLWCYDALRCEAFDSSKRSYRDLIHSIAAYLNAPTPPRFRFTVKKPKKVSNARFGEPAQYYINLALLSNQLPWQLTPEESREVNTMALLSALFYGPGLLKSALGTDAVYNDLASIINFRQLRPIMPEIATEALNTWERHLDYLTPQLVVLALVCDKFSPEERNTLARALLTLLPSRDWDLPPTRVSYPGPNFTKTDNFLPSDNTMPDLGQFVTLDSFLIFNILQTSDEVLQEWQQQTGGL